MARLDETQILSTLDRATTWARILAGKIPWPKKLSQVEAQAVWPDADMIDDHLVCMRLLAFSANAHWAIVIEQIVVSNQPKGHDGISVELYFYGNCLKSQQFHERRIVFPLTCVAPDSELLDFDDTSRPRIRVSPKARTIWLRGKPIRLPLSDELVRAAGQTPRKSMLPAITFGRVLMFHAGALLRAQPREISAAFGVRLKRRLELNSWRHPESLDGPPSESQTFQMIAKVLVTGDSSWYRTTERPNTPDPRRRRLFEPPPGLKALPTRSAAT